VLGKRLEGLVLPGFEPDARIRAEPILRGGLRTPRGKPGGADPRAGRARGRSGGDHRRRQG
jgi:hypothetical protein